MAKQGAKKRSIGYLIWVGMVILIQVLIEGCQPDKTHNSSSLSIAAAASLMNVVQEVNQRYHRQLPDIQLEVSFGATSLLARQVEQGAPVDVILSANREWMDYLIQKRKVDPKSVIIIAQNRMVWVVPATSSLNTVSDTILNGNTVHRIAVADWHHVPAGKYARYVLQKMGIWEVLKPRLIPALDVRAALAYVEQGNAELGMVYESDARISQKVKSIPVPDAYQPFIIYEGGITVTANSMARNYLQFWSSDTTQKILKKFGFTPVSHDLIIHAQQEQ